MSTPIKCTFCGETFEHDPAIGESHMDCPHCGNTLAAAKPSGGVKDMRILRDAPSLAGIISCPSCKAQIEKGSVLCIHCGYNLATGQKVAGGSWMASNQKMVLMAGGGLAALILVAVVAMFLWPEPPPPPPPFVPAAAPAAPRPAAPPAGTEPAAEAPAPGEVEPTAAVEEPPPPDPAELAARRAEAERLEFEAKKARAQVALRDQLDTREPMYVAGDTVEIRRRNGLVHIGELQRYTGSGQNRVAVIATSTGEIGVPIVALDPPSRRRMDPDFRDAFILHLLNTRLAEEAEPPAAN